jgi:hypothetical protein
MPPSKVAQRFRFLVQRPRTTDALNTLQSNGTIDQNSYSGGRLFQQAQINPLLAPLLTRIPRSQHDPLVPGEARVRLTKLLDRLGGLDSSTGRRTWAMREGWSARRICAEAAQGILIAVLGMLGSRRQNCRYTLNSIGSFCYTRSELDDCILTQPHCSRVLPGLSRNAGGRSARLS